MVYGVLKLEMGDEKMGSCTISATSQFLCKDFWFLEKYYYGSFSDVTFEGSNATKACGEFRLLYDSSKATACTRGTTYVPGSIVDCHWLETWHWFGFTKEECRVHQRPRYFDSLIAFFIGGFLLLCGPATLCLPRICCYKEKTARVQQYTPLIDGMRGSHDDDSDDAHDGGKTMKSKAAGDKSSLESCCGGSRKVPAQE